MPFYRRHQVSEEEKQIIYNARSSVEAAKLTGYSVSWCWNLRKQLGIPLAHTPYTREEIKRLKALYKHSGLPMRKIAEELGRSTSSIFRKLKYLRERGQL
jgi:transposase